MSAGQHSVCKRLRKSSNSHQGRNECNYQGTCTGILYTISLPLLVSVIARALSGQKVARNTFSWHPSVENLVCDLFERSTTKSLEFHIQR